MLAKGAAFDIEPPRALVYFQIVRPKRLNS